MFDQFKLDRSVGNQNRDIFNRYIYETGDTTTEVLTPGYFSKSRFLIEEPNKWKGSFIEATTSDGYLVFQVSSDGESVGIVSSVGPDNLIIINRESDFSIQDATTITLENDKAYLAGADLSTIKRFIVGTNVAILSQNTSVVWETSSSGDMFSGTDVDNFSIFNISLRCPNAQVFNFDDTVAGFSRINILNLIGESLTPATLIAEKFGTFTDVRSLLIDNVAFATGLGINDGVTLAGTSLKALSIITFGMFSTSASYVGFDYGSVVIDTLCNIVAFEQTNNEGGSTGISGLAASANIGTDILAAYMNCTFIGSITPLSGISSSDLRHEFSKSLPVLDSTKTADTFLSSSETVSISMASVFVTIGGTNWLSDVLERFSTTTAGILTYLAPGTIKAQIIISATVAKDSGGSDELQLAVAINGTEATKTIVATKNNEPTALTSIGIFTLNTGDTIQAFVANDTGTTDIVVSKCVVNLINSS